MAKQSKSVPALDDELDAWLDTAEDETREVIVEVHVPQRRVRLGAGTSHGARLSEVTTEDGPSRAAVLQEVQEFLTGLLGTPPRILQTAGAIALRATKDQLRQIARHPLVKAIRANRRLK